MLASKTDFLLLSLVTAWASKPATFMTETNCSPKRFRAVTIIINEQQWHQEAQCFSRACRSCSNDVVVVVMSLELGKAQIDLEQTGSHPKNLLCCIPDLSG